MEVIVLIPVLIGIGLFFWAEQVRDKHPILALLFQLMFIPLVYLTVDLAMTYVSVVYAANSEIVRVLGDVVYYLGWVIFIIGVYYCFVVMGKIYDIVRQRNNDKEAEMYD